MTLKHPDAAVAASDDLSVAPIFNRESHTIPRHELPEGELPPDVAYQIVHDELMLDGNARLNLATFVTTWMEPQAERLMAECFDKNMIDKDEYPQTAELETRCVNMLSRLWHAPGRRTRRSAARPPARARRRCSAGSRSSAAGSSAREAAGKPADRPNLVMGINVQVCWEKFANYWDVEMRLVPMEGDRLHLSAEEAVERCDENTIGVVAILGSTFDGSYEPVAEICAALDAFQDETGLDIPVHVDGASGAFVAPVPRPGPGLGLPAAARRLDQRLGPQVRPGLPGRRLGRLARRGGAARGPGLLGQLPRRQHADVRAQLLAARRPGRRAVLQLPAPRLRRLPARAAATRATSPRGCRRRSPSSARSSCSPRRRAAGVRLHAARTTSTTSPSSTSRTRCASAAGCVPAYTFPENRTDLAALRVVVRRGFTHDLADMLLDDLEAAAAAAGEAADAGARRERGVRLPPLAAPAMEWSLAVIAGSRCSATPPHRGGCAAPWSARRWSSRL